MIQFVHQREYNLNETPEPKGGRTKVLWVPEKSEIEALVHQHEPKIKMCFGKARCHPNDHYNKKIGRKLAQQKAEISEFKLVAISYYKGKITYILSSDVESVRLESKPNRNKLYYID